MTNGYLSIVLHAHLPFVRHPEYPSYLEEDWLFEAISECYLPLLRMMERLWRDAVPFRITMTMTPPLCEMLADPMLQSRYVAQLEKMRELAHVQAKAQHGTPFHDVAQMYVHELDAASREYNEKWQRNILAAFKLFQDRGSLEIITCGATHGFLPLMATTESRRAQLQVAVRNYQKHFGRRPRGIWLPECAYTPQLDDLLAEAGLRFFFLEGHALTGATPPARFGTSRPVFTPNGLAAFGRDAASSHQVWSSSDGYPGDFYYREFYRDLGYDLPYEEIKPYLHPDGVRRNVGMKFHRITGQVDLGAKKPYLPSVALEHADSHASDFLRRNRDHIRQIKDATGFRPHITSPYDAELFGHWWFEGPLFLEMFLRKTSCDQDEIKLITPSEYLEIEPVHQVCQPALSSWGDGGYFKVWLNGYNDWIYRHLHQAEQRMVELVRRFPDASGVQKRALNQASRELLLAQSSDWAFIITMRTSVPYAEKRTRDHIANFNTLYEQLCGGDVDTEVLGELEWKNSIFQEIDYRIGWQS